METFWFFRLRFRRAYDSAYDSDFRLSLGHKVSYDSNSDSVTSETQPLQNAKYNLEKFSLFFSSLSFIIRVNLLHPYPFLFLHGFLLSLWCSSILTIYCFQVSFNRKVILFAVKKNNSKYSDKILLKSSLFSFTLLHDHKKRDGEIPARKLLAKHAVNSLAFLFCFVSFFFQFSLEDLRE